MARMTKFMIEQLTNLARENINAGANITLQPLKDNLNDLSGILRVENRIGILKRATISGHGSYLSVSIHKDDQAEFKRVYDIKSNSIRNKIQKIEKKMKDILTEFKRQLIMGENDGKKLPKYK